MKLTEIDLRKALAVSELAHSGQEYGGKPYFTAHVWPVVQRCKGFEEKCLGAIHDICELPEWVAGTLIQHGLDATLARNGQAMVRHPDTTYHDYITRVMGDPLLRAVKINDLIVNISSGRLPLDRMNKYARALTRLTEEERC